MNTLIDTPKDAKHVDGFIVITMSSGETIRFPVAENKRLRGASHLELDDIEFSPFGLHWPQLDEDLSIRGLLAGHHG